MRELEDRKWFPEFLRRHQMDYLSLLATKFNLYEPLANQITTWVENSENHDWTDVCSGSAGPVLSFNTSHNILLTDLFPPKEDLKLPVHITYYPKAVDIIQKLPPGSGFISMFNSFHHFNPNEQKEILKKIRDSGRPFLVVEILQPTLSSLISVIFTTTIGHWLLVPFMRPFSLSRLLFTYLIPIHTLTVCFDGIVSVFKSRSNSYYHNLASKMSSTSYSFSFISIKGRYGPLSTLKGFPTEK